MKNLSVKGKGKSENIPITKVKRVFIKVSNWTKSPWCVLFLFFADELVSQIIETVSRFIAKATFIINKYRSYLIEIYVLSIRAEFVLQKFGSEQLLMRFYYKLQKENFYPISETEKIKSFKNKKKDRTTTKSAQLIEKWANFDCD